MTKVLFMTVASKIKDGEKRASILNFIDSLGTADDAGSPCEPDVVAGSRA